MLSRDQIEGRIGQSAMMLDRLEPGWRGRIDLETLNVAYSSHCVVGQLYGSYQRGRAELLAKGASPSDLGGFETRGRRETSDTEFRILTDGWRKFITKTPEFATA